MLGLAGAGWFLLRLDDPERTPSVLLPDVRFTGPAPHPVVAAAFAAEAFASDGGRGRPVGVGAGAGDEDDRREAG